MLSLAQARARLLTTAVPLRAVERIPTQAALGRVLAEAVLAQLAVPPLDNAQMDGYAVRCADLDRAAILPVVLRAVAGQPPGVLPRGAAARIFTGAPLPQGADAVVMQEGAQVLRAAASGPARVQLLEKPRPGQWIGRAGSDMARGAVALAPGQGLGPAQLGMAAAAGATHVTVVRRPRVALLCSGSELVMPGTTPAAGQIYDSNRFVLGGLLAALGCEVDHQGMVPDDLAALRLTLQRAAERADLVLSSGGVSVGEEDHVKAAVAALGAIDAWQVAIKPGKPLAFGRVGAVPFIGLPGNPVSAFVSFVLFVRPFLLRLLGLSRDAVAPLALRADFERLPDPQRREFLRVRRNAQGGLDLYPNQNSALLSSLAWADGLADLPPGTAVARGRTLAFLPLSELLSLPLGP